MNSNKTQTPRAQRVALPFLSHSFPIPGVASNKHETRVSLADNTMRSTLPSIKHDGSKEALGSMEEGGNYEKN